MDDYNLKDVQWKEVGSEDSFIKFKKSKRFTRLKIFFKILIFIIIASVSGAITSLYITNRTIEKSSTYDALENYNDIEEYEPYDIPANAINRVAENVGPAVVGISNKGTDFFGGEIDQSSGSGIIFTSDGYIVTNYHVIKGASKVSVKLSTGKVLEAKLIGYDEISDLAVIKVEATNLSYAVFGDSSKVRVGDIAIAIGNPLGEEFAGSVTSGIISAVNRSITRGSTIYKVIQTDAAINPGNSGGALCNEVGEVIGINSLKMSSDYGYNIEGMGFAISINEAKIIIDSLMNEGKVLRPYLGITGYTNTEGVYVKEVIKDSPAFNAGINPTDIIVEFNDVSIESVEQFQDVINSSEVEENIVIKLLRNNKTYELTVILEKK
ncbi:MAG: S1C family serine protease [Clostridiaceae bacterium]